MKSEQIDQLATALSKCQAEMPAVPMNAENPFLKNKYADLGEMIRVATPVLGKNGLSVSQQVTSNDGHIGVQTTLMHTSGQWIDSAISLPLGDEKGKSLAQVAGSIITYLRRYSYGAIVGLYTDEDADGNTISKNHEKPDVPYKAEPVNLENIPEMSLKVAESETNRDGKLYGTLATDDLVHMANALLKMKTRTDEHARKLAAIQTIMAHRAAGTSA